MPVSVAGDQGDGERPVLCSDVENGGSVRFLDQTVHFLILLAELLALQLVLLFIARGRDFGSCSQNRFQRLLISSVCSLNERGNSLRRR